MKLYPWQEEAYNELSKHDFNGVVKVASGKGKTVLAIKIIQDILKENKGEKAIVVVPTISLMEQWNKEFEKFAPEIKKSLFYGAKHDRSGDVILSVINTASKLELINEEIAIKVLDEIHHYGAELYQSIFSLRSKHTIGLSATPERNDEGDLAIRFGAGKIVYSLHDLDELKKRFSLCTIRVPFTTGEYSEYIELQREYRQILAMKGINPDRIQSYVRKGNKYALRVLKLWTKMTALRHKATNKLPVIEKLVLAEQDKKIIIFSESIMYSEALHQTLKRSIVVHSELTKKNVLKRLEEFKKLDYGILIAPRMIDEGYDVPDANVAIVASFTRTGRQMIQRDGRLLRRDDLVRRYTLVMKDVEEEKFFSILRQTETQEIAMNGSWLRWENGFIDDLEYKNKCKEYFSHENFKQYEDWLINKLDFFQKLEYVETDFYERHKQIIHNLIEEHPRRWKILEKKVDMPKEKNYSLENNYSDEERRIIKNDLRKLNSRLFLPETFFFALIRYIDEEPFTLDNKDKELLERLNSHMDDELWPENIQKLIKDIQPKVK